MRMNVTLPTAGVTLNTLFRFVPDAAPMKPTAPRPDHRIRSERDNLVDVDVRLPETKSLCLRV